MIGNAEKEDLGFIQKEIPEEKLGTYPSHCLLLSARSSYHALANYTCGWQAKTHPGEVPSTRRRWGLTACAAIGMCPAEWEYPLELKCIGRLNTVLVKSNLLFRG